MMDDFVVNNPNSSFASRFDAKSSVYSPRFYDDSPRDLWEALDWGSSDDVRRLIEEGADPNGADEYGVTPLMIAAARGSVDKVIALLDHRASLDAQDENGKTALMVAVFNGHAEVVMLLLEKGANPDIADNDGSTALMLAAYNNEARIARILLEGKASPNIKDNNGSTALVYAAFYANWHKESNAFGSTKKGEGIAAVRALLASGADPNVCVEEDGDPLLIWAAKNNNEDLVRALTVGGADPKIKAKGRWSALAYTNNEDIVRMLYAASKKLDASMCRGD